MATYATMTITNIVISDGFITEVISLIDGLIGKEDLKKCKK